MLNACVVVIAHISLNASSRHYLVKNLLSAFKFGNAVSRKWRL